MGELLLYGWASGVLSALQSHDTFMLVVLIGGPLAFIMAAWAASRPRVVAARLNRARKEQEEARPIATMPSVIEVPVVPSGAVQDADEWRPIQGNGIIEDFELGEPTQPVPNGERVMRLQLEIHRLRAIVEAFQGDAVARLRGRVVSW